MNIYISLPISGFPIDDAQARAIFASGVIESKGHSPINPFDFGEGDGKSYGQYLGEDITVLIDKADAVLFLSGWNGSRGCNLEFCAARIYGKQMFFHLDEIPAIQC